MVNGVDQAGLSDGTNLASRTTSCSFTRTLVSASHWIIELSRRYALLNSNLQTSTNPNTALPDIAPPSLSAHGSISIYCRTPYAATNCGKQWCHIGVWVGLYVQYESWRPLAVMSRQFLWHRCATCTRNETSKASCIPFFPARVTVNICGVTSCSAVSRYRGFEDTCYLHLQSRRVIYPDTGDHVGEQV
jgi:hypothetical protein